MRQTIERVLPFEPLNPPYVICSARHGALVQSELSDWALKEEIFLEPVGRNTAPAIAMAALRAVQNGDPLLLVLPSDHRLSDLKRFERAVEDAAELAMEGWLCTFGIVPDHPETGYGYILRSQRILNGFKVERFVEKPSLDRAKAYLADGRYNWNSGMFLFRASSLLREMERWAPDVLQACQKAYHSISYEGAFLQIPKDDFEKCPSISIDYAVMEKTDRAVVVPLDAGWSDVGSWDAVYALHEEDACKNVIVGQGFVHCGEGNYVHSSHRLVALEHVNDLMVIATDRAVCVMKRGESQRVKDLVEALESQNLMPNQGSWRPIASQETYCIAECRLASGQTIELNEEWASICVVEGEIELKSEQEKQLLKKGESKEISVQNPFVISNATAMPALLLKTTWNAVER